jgi:hypothetical protein
MDAPERHEVTGKDGAPIAPVVNQSLVLAALPDDQLQARLRGLIERLSAAPPELPPAETVLDVKAEDPQVAAYAAALAKRNGHG